VVDEGALFGALVAVDARTRGVCTDAAFGPDPLQRVVRGWAFVQFRLARRQLLDLLNIQAEAFSYQSAATTAFYDEQIARARLLASMGDLAKRF
jgi:hypothetical protein